MRHYPRVCALQCLQDQCCLGGGVFVSPAPAYADGYVDGTGNNIYYGFKTDAQYAEAHFNIDVEYYDTFDHAKAGGIEGKDPLGKYVRVHYLSNSKNQGVTADEWKFRPMWWFGVPAGLKDPQDIQFKRIEKLTKTGNQKFTPAGSSQQITTDANGYGVVSDKHFNSPKDWNNISNYYFSDQKILASKGWKQLMGLDAKGNKGYDDNGNTVKHWEEYQQQTQGLKGIFVDWESAGRRWYDMTYVSEMTDDAWKKRDENPLRFAAGVYRFAGNWHYAVGQKHNTPRIADHIDLKYPELTPVKNLKNVSTDEQNAIKDKIATANKDTKHYSDLVDKVEVSDKGVATITFKDKSTRTISADLLVFKNEEDKDKYKPIMPARTPVVKPSKLTEDDKKAVIAAFKKANPDNSEFSKHLAETDGIKFDDNGTKLIVTYQDGSKLEIPASELVCQGATIADWAPYVVPDIIDVDNLNQLKPDEITKIIKAFDDANTGITPYDESKTKNGKAPVEVNKTTGDATITWEDGSTTTISAWQFLKEKPKTPTPEPPSPTPTAEKEFIVEAPQNQTRVKFDPFNMKESDLTTYSKTALDSDKNGLKKVKGKDSKDNSEVTITDVSYSVKDGKGYITFKANGYKDATYPMSVFFKKDQSAPTPQTPSTETKTETDTEHPENTFTYKVTKTEIEGDKPTPQDATKALKQFVTDNYDNVSEADLSSITDSVNVKATWIPKTGTRNMGSYDASGSNYGPMMSFSIAGNDFGIKVHGRPWDPDADNGPDWNSSMDMDLFTIKPDELYVKKAGAQQQDNTLDKLKQQAKDLLKQKRDTDKLSNNDLTRAGIAEADKLNNDKIDGMNEKELRKLIRQLTDAKKAERKYNPIPEIEVTDPENLSEADFKKAVEAFLKANYDGTDSLAVDKVPYTVPTSLKPKTDTVLMEPASDTNATGISSIKYTNSDFKTLIFTDKNNNQLFTVSVKYKKKAEDPAPNPDALAQMKKDAEQQIDRNPNLTKEQKEEYKKQIEEATTPDKIKEILNKAAQQGKENQNDPTKTQTITDNKGGGNAKKEAEDKKQKEEEKQKEQKLKEDKDKAKEALNTLNNLTTDGDSGDKNKLSGEIDKAKTPEEVNNILEKAKAINDARGALQNDIKKGALPFLDHGTGDKNNTADTHADDAALNELLGTKSGKDQTLTDLENALKDSNATAESINNALAKAKLQNTSNEQNAKIAGIAKLEAKKAELVAAYNALNDEQKEKAKAKYEAAVNEINTAKGKVNSATKPSDIKTSIDGVKASFDDAITAINNAKGTRDTSGNTNDDPDALAKEKKDQIARINNSNLPQEDKDKAIEDINAATKLGDPTGIADRALKAKKIEDAKKQIAALDHLNNAQKEAFKRIIEDTDASDHKNDDGSTSDDIDDALANAANTDNAMARLDELKKKANDFKGTDKYTNANQDKKTAFDNASTAAGAVLDKANGDAKNADQVNELYKDLLNKMRDLDPNAQSAGVNTEALNKEIESDKKLKPDDQADPKTAGDSVYTTASADKKKAFDDALTEAETALNKANGDNDNDKKPGTTPRTPEKEAEDQKAVDAALDKLIKARLALDGVDTTDLQKEIDKESATTSSDAYKYDSQENQNNYNNALKAAKELIKQLTSNDQQQDPSQGGTQKPKTQAEKQKIVDDALANLKAAEEALKGKKPVEPTPTPTPSVDKSHLQQGINGSGDVKKSDDYNNAPSDKKQAYDHALDHANEVNNDPNATQDQVNQAAEDLKKAENDLKPTPTPLPSPVPGGAGFGVNDNAPTTVDKGELNIQIDSAEADSQPGNAGAGNNNAGNTNAGAGANSGNASNANANAANANANAANGANSAAVDAAVESKQAVKQADAQVANAQAALDSALAEAKKVAADPNATQAQVDAAAQKLSAARKALADAKAHADEVRASVRASVRAQVLKRSKGMKLSKTGSNVSAFGLFAASVATAGAALFVSKRRGISRHSSK